MADVMLVVGAHMRAMVARLGCFDAVAATISGRWGEPISKGTISRKMNGTLDWAVRYVIALEDALDSYPVTQLQQKRLTKATPPRANLAPTACAANVARETGEAVSAILVAAMSNGSTDKARAIREIDEAISDLQMARAVLAGCGS